MLTLLNRELNNYLTALKESVENNYTRETILALIERCVSLSNRIEGELNGQRND